VFLLAFAALFVIGMPDMLLGMGHSVLPFHTAHWGILVFTVGLGLVVEGRVRDQQQSLERASEELARRLDELRVLNDELRRQIAERSRELATALAAAGEVRPAPARIEAGGVFDGRYRVLRRLGEGGMGAVYEVARMSDDRRLALKVMTGQATANAAARFAREAEIAARLDHPNLVSVLDVGVSEGALYLAMELVRGGSLEDHRARFGDRGWALLVLEQVAEALRALHASGVVHRDLKPANVLLVDGSVEPPRVKVADFGIARFGDPTESDQELPSARQPTAPAAPIPLAGAARLTVTGSMMGTPQYMAPELALGADLARPPADVFAFGVLAVELLTAGYPFPAPPVFSALYRKPIAKPELPAVSAPLDPELKALLEACLDAAPERRPPIAEVLALLRKLAGR
jgi:serine/threonine-protein kinase